MYCLEILNGEEKGLLLGFRWITSFDFEIDLNDIYMVKHKIYFYELERVITESYIVKR